MEIKTTGSRIVYGNRWMRVREDRIERANGAPGIYSVVEKLDYSLIIPRDDQGVFLVEQYRYPVQGRYWEFPQGTWEERPEADPTEVAREELEAETGLRAASLIGLGHIFGAYGLTAQRCHVFVATDLTQGEARPDPDVQERGPGIRLRRGARRPPRRGCAVRRNLDEPGRALLLRAAACDRRRRVAPGHCGQCRGVRVRRAQRLEDGPSDHQRDSR